MLPPEATSGDGVVPFVEGLAAIGEQMVMVLDLGKLNTDAALPEAA